MSPILNICMHGDSYTTAPRGVWDLLIIRRPSRRNLFDLLYHLSRKQMLMHPITVNNPDHVRRAHHYLYSKVFGRQHAFPFSSLTRAIAGNTLAVVNGATAASPAPAAAPQQPGLLDQLPLPGGPLLGTLPIREQPLAVTSLETSLPAVSAAAAPSAPPEQQAREHGALLLLGSQEQEALEEVQDDEDDGGVELGKSGHDRESG